MAVKIDLNKENLEKNLKEELIKENKISKEEEIGFHKGSLNTLVAERNELIKMISTVESIIQAHLKRLEELGVQIKK